MKFCKDCTHFEVHRDVCQHPEHSPILDTVSGTRGYIQAEICRALPALCGTYAFRFTPRITSGTVEDWEAA